MGLPGYTTWSPGVSRPTSCSSTTSAEATDTWTVVLRPNGTPRFTIHLDGETVRQIREEVAEVSHDHLETGGYLFARCPWTRAMCVSPTRLAQGRDRAMGGAAWRSRGRLTCAVS
jgi:hypothetical protein